MIHLILSGLIRGDPSTDARDDIAFWALAKP